MLSKEKKEKKAKKKKAKGYICSTDRHTFLLAPTNLKPARAKITFRQKKNMHPPHPAKKHGVKRPPRYLKTTRSPDKFPPETEKMLY